MNIKNKSVGLYSLGILINFLLSYIVLVYQQPFNVDGIVYLNAAESYLSGGFHAATQVYNWPFYSIYLSILSQITHLSLINTAWFFNAILSSILVVFFILLIKEAGGSLKIQYWGLFIILIYPYLNHDRYNILRDFGYYTFFMVSLWSLIKFAQKNEWKYALLWQFTTLIAISFRLEGIIILGVVPFSLFFIREWTWKERIVKYLKVNAINIFMLVIAVIICKECLNYGRIPEVVNEIRPEQILGTFQQKITVIQQQVFDVFGKNNAALFLFGGLFVLFVKAIIDTLGLFYVLLAGFGITSKEVRLESLSRVIIIFYAIGVLITLVGFLSQQLFLSGRYVVPLALLCMLWIPFGLETLWNKRKPLLKIILSVLLLIMIIDSAILFGPSKTYLVKAGEWISFQTPSETRLYTNDPQLYYYAHRSGLNYPHDFPDQNWWPRLQQIKVADYNYIAIVIRHDEKIPAEQDLIQLVGSEPLQTFQNSRNDKAYIFKVSDHE